MMIRLSPLPAALLALALPAVAIAAPARWSAAFARGTSDYSIGTVGPDTSSLILSCRSDGRADIAVARQGVAPRPYSIVAFAIGATRMEFRTTRDGFVEIRDAAVAPQFAGFWRALRGGRTIAVSFADGRRESFPLTGAAATLPLRPCSSIGGR